VHYDPLSARDVADTDLDTLHETVMPWMVAPLVRWLGQFLMSRDDLGEGFSNLDFIEALEINTRLTSPLDRLNVMADVEHRMEQDTSFGIKAAAYALSTLDVYRTPGHEVSAPAAQLLERLLRESDSAWQVTEVDAPRGVEGEMQLVLTRRDLASAKLAISDIRSQDARAGAFLADAWKAIATRDPQPGEAYDKAVKAIEVAAQPVVLPANPNATLGQIISAMNDKPSKWAFPLGDLCLVTDMSERVWTNHFRHGTQPRDDHTPEEADAAVHLAIPLVRFFLGGLVQPADAPEP
jgi:hypothetical protein